jgi:protection-of-telomeres protein 1
VLLNKDDSQKTILPFNVAKYRANVRIVGYFPDRLQDFAVGRRESEFDILSDYSGGEDTNPEEDRRLWKEGKGFGKKRWEWRFALQVEDADPKAPKERLWLIVDNHSGQGLLDMDATK